MTRVDFHFNAPDKLAYVCRLVRKAFLKNSKLVIYSSERSLLETVDDELWAFSSTDFLPHCFADDELAEDTPILLTTDGEHLQHHDVLVNLDGDCPPFFSRFERLIEVVSTEEADREKARVRWRYYQDRGYAMNRFDVAAAGG